MDSTLILIPISPAELIDRVTILQLKKERISDAEKLTHIERELKMLEEKIDNLLDSPKLRKLTEALRDANARIWEGEELIRAHWKDNEKVLAASRLSHAGNDERFRIKFEINLLLGSEITEVKSHQR